MTPTRARRLFHAGLAVLVASLAAGGYVACSGNAAAPTDAGVDLTHRSSGQIITPPGLGRVVTSGGILGGSGTTSNPLTATLSVSGAISGTGSAGSPLTSSSTVSTTSPVTGTGSAGSPVTTSFTDTAPFQGTGSAGSPFSIATNGISNTLIRQSVGVSVIGRSANSTGNVGDIVAGSDGQVLTRASGALTWADPATIVPSVVPYMGIFGDGSDGAITFDGTTTVLGFAPSSNVYVVNRDVFATNATINSGVRVVFAQVDNEGANSTTARNTRLFCTGTLTVAGRLTENGAPGTNGGGGGAGSTGGVGTGATISFVSSGGAGSSNAAGVGGTAQVGHYIFPTQTGTLGGAALNAGSNAVGSYLGGGGGGGSSTAGGAGGNTTTVGASIGGMRDFRALTTSVPPYSGSFSQVAYNGTGGGGGGGDGVAGHAGGGGGGGGGMLIAICNTLAGSGSIEAHGGAGGNGNTSFNTGGGGGGGGGTIVLAYANGTPPTTNVAAGAGGTGHGTGGNGGNGTAGKVFLLH